MSKDTVLDYFDGDDLAESTWVGKYKLDENEITPDGMHHRMASEFYRIDEKFQKNEDSFWNKRSLFWNKKKLSEYGQVREKLTEDSIYKLFKDFKYVIPQGSVMSQLGNHYVIGSLSNCFVLASPKDSYGGIMQTDQQIVQLEKRRVGVGVDISTLRPNGVKVANAAKTSTGAVSFMSRYSNTTREVAQGGRRGALMLSMNVNHPDIEDFIKSKEDKNKITGANISVLLTDEFMEAVKTDSDYFLSFPVDYNTNNFPDREKLEYDVLSEYIDGGDVVYVKKVRAKKIYDLLVHNAWASGEPGQMFLNTHWGRSPDGVYLQYKGITSNPCGEIFMGDGDACRLIAINLYSFVKNPFMENAAFDYEKFYRYIYEQQRLSDNLVELELEKIDDILDKILSDKEDMKIKQAEYDLWLKMRSAGKSGRRTGNGFTGLGDMLAALGSKYDSDYAQLIVGKMMKTKMLAEFDCSIDLSILRGSFIGWDPKLEFKAYKGKIIGGQNDFYNNMSREFPDLSTRMLKYGRRNVSISTVSPTGSLSMLAKVTSGLEPVFLVFYKRRKKINPNDVDAVVDFIDDNGDKWTEFNVLHPKFKEWVKLECALQNINDNVDDMSEDDLMKFFKLSPWYESTANDVNWVKRVEMQGIIQNYTTHSISSTINLPKDATEEDVYEIYMGAWEKGLKGITVYRDGSRDGVLISTTENKDEGIKYNSAPKRPKSLKCDIYHPTVNGKLYTVLIGLLNGKPYEVFAMDYEIAKNRDSGIIKKVKSGHYDLIVHVRDTNEIIDRINDNISETEATLTMSISGNLRHGMEVSFIVDFLNKSKGSLMGFSKSIARTLKRYIPEGAKSTTKCDICGSGNVHFEEGCSKCYDCGHSACG